MSVPSISFSKKLSYSCSFTYAVFYLNMYFVQRMSVYAFAFGIKFNAKLII